MFDEASYLREHPEAWEHPGRGLGHFVTAATDDTVLPVPAAHSGRAPRWGAWRRQGRDSVRSWNDLRRSADVDGSSPELTSIDWEALGRNVSGRTNRRTSILIPTYHDWRMTVDAVRAVLHGTPGLDVEAIVVDNGSDAFVSRLLASALGGDSRVRILTMADNTGFAAGSNLAFAASTGDRVVFLNNDTLVQPGWLGPLLEELEDANVMAAQPLLTYDDGTVQCAGVWFPGGGGLPSHFLADHPALDAQRMGRFDVRAITGAAFAMRAADVVRMRGFDASYVNGWEDVDLCMRLTDGVPSARLRVVTDSQVVHFESKTPGRGHFQKENRQLFVARWRDRLDAGDEALMTVAGFDLVGLDVDPVQLRHELPAPRPVLRRQLRPDVDGVPPLRWAIKIPSRSGPSGDTWGDTFFGADLAAALRRLGQEVVVDRRDAIVRHTSYLDDVTVTIRGLVEVVPDPARTNLLWVISHPDLVTPDEVRRYDAAFAASTSWSARMTELAGLPVVPLLQATDPRRFHPGAADHRGEDVVFVANFRADRPVVEAARAAGLDLSIYGKGWDDTSVRDQVRSGFVANDELGRIYSGAGFVLNDSHADMSREGFMPNRLFDAVASGARVITDEVGADVSVFDGAVQVYRDVEDLALLCSPAGRDRFPDDAALARIAAAVARDHSFDARARVLLDTALRLRAATPT
jgi:GT2 family glycosyltransferase